MKYYKCPDCKKKGVHQIHYKTIIEKYIGSHGNPIDAECKYCEKRFNDDEFYTFLQNIKSDVKKDV